MLGFLFSIKSHGAQGYLRFAGILFVDWKLPSIPMHLSSTHIGMRKRESDLEFLNEELGQEISCKFCSSDFKSIAFFGSLRICALLLQREQGCVMGIL